MGATFVTLNMDGRKSRAEVQKDFEREQDQDRYENGHSYSGGIGMANGLKFTGKEFEREDDAYEWLSENCQKWEAAQAVTFKGKDGEPFWMIGATCSS